MTYLVLSNFFIKKFQRKLFFRYSLSIEKQIASKVANQIVAFAIVYYCGSTNDYSLLLCRVLELCSSESCVSPAFIAFHSTQICYNLSFADLLKQLAASLWTDNKF